MNVICLYYFLFKSLVLYYTYFMFYIFIYSKCTYIELYWTRFGWPILLSTIFGCIFILLVLRETASYLLFSSVGLCCCFSSSDLCWRGVWLCLKTLYKHGQALFLTKSCKWGITFFVDVTAVSLSFSEMSSLSVPCIHALTLALVLV